MRDLSCGDTRVYLDVEVRRVLCRSCGQVKRERLDWLADNPLYTKRFAWHIGRRCRHMTVRDVAHEFHLDWHTVKEQDKPFDFAQDKPYMRAQLTGVGTPAPEVIGIDEISVRKGHDYRIVVSDLLRMRPLWFGGQDRKESSMAQFYEWLGPRKSARIRLAVMDRWRPFRNATACFQSFEITQIDPHEYAMSRNS